MPIILRAVAGVLIGLLLAAPGVAEQGNRITPSIYSVEVQHQGNAITIGREADPNASIPEDYSRVGRQCPPFCIQPIQVLPGVDTVGELEVLEYLRRITAGDESLLVVDSRTPEWVRNGTIPGSINIPWNMINMEVNGEFEQEAAADTLVKLLTTRFAARLVNGQWDFSEAKTLVLFCNGLWCPQSAINIKTLVKLGFPPGKLKWYRGGMQSWVTAGLTTVGN